MTYVRTANRVGFPIKCDYSLIGYVSILLNGKDKMIHVQLYEMMAVCLAKAGTPCVDITSNLE